MLVSSCWVPPQVSARLHRSMQNAPAGFEKISGLVDTGAHQLDTAGAHQLRGKLSLKGMALMTALVDFPVTELPTRVTPAIVSLPDVDSRSCRSRCMPPARSWAELFRDATRRACRDRSGLDGLRRRAGGCARLALQTPGRTLGRNGAEP